MQAFLPFIVSGIAVGAIYGLAATGLVLTYKTSGIFDFGYGALAAIGAYAFYWLHVEEGLGWGVSMAISVLVIGPIVGLTMEQFAERLMRQRTPLKIVGTIGIVLIVQGLAAVKYGPNTIPLPQFLPHANDSFVVFNVVVTYDKVIIAAIALVAVLSLYAFFRWSRTGLAMRAVVDDPDLLAMRATDPVRVRRTSWVIGSTFAALSGVLIAPLIGLNAILLTFLVVQAAAAAAIGAFLSIPLTFIGGLLIGVIADISKKYVLDVSWLTGLPASLPFLVLFVVLLVRGRSLVQLSRIEARPRLQYRAPGRIRLAVGALVLVPLLLVPQIVGDNLSFFTVGLVNGLMLLSLGLLVRMSGQISLCQAAFAAIGAVAFSQLQIELGLPWLLAFVLGGLVAVPVGALVAIPAIRLSGLFLALATFGFGILVQQLLYPQEFMFTSLAQGRAMPHPSFAQSDESFYYVVLAALSIAAVLVVLIQRGRLGRMLRGLADSPRGVASMGLSTNVIRVTVFCISAFLAAEAGILLGVSENFASGGDPFFDSYNSLILLAMLTLAPFAEPWYALVAVVAAVLPAYIHGDNTTNWLNVLFGLSAVFVAASGGTQTMPARLRSLLDRFAPPRRRRKPSSEPPARLPPRGGVGGIEVRDLTIKFGGLVAVDSLSFNAPLGRITGLIGPNGAGKTSTFDACSGFNRRFAGSVQLHGEDVTGKPPPARARRGLGRTFQAMALCDTLTVRENVQIGDEASRAGFNSLTQLGASRSSWQATEAATEVALEQCGIVELAEVQAGALSTGQRRLVELARCLAGPFDFLLLDEPSSGLDRDETSRFADVLVQVMKSRKLGILLVEHDIALVMEICEYVYVMDFGELVAAGTPSEISASDVVQSAYLGTKSASTAIERRQVGEEAV